MKAEMMKFEEFKAVVVEKIREYLPISFAIADVEVQTVIKNNDLKLSGLTIKSVSSNISPTIYLEKFYDEYVDGTDIEIILKKIAEVRMSTEVEEPFDVMQFTCLDNAREKIVPRLINAAMNKELLKQKAHKLVADLAITYHIILDSFNDDSVANIAVTNELLNHWNITVEELNDIAVANLPRLLPSTFKGMTEVMAGMLGEDDLGLLSIPNDEEQMYVLTNDKKMHGASALLDKAMMEYIVNRVGEFYIIPSSIHETLIVPVKSGLDIEQLEDMVREVNATQVAIEEQLSNHIYKYNTEEGIYLAN